MMTIQRWPKKVAELTPEQQKIRDEFMVKWLEELPVRYGLAENFNQSYPLRTYRAGARTLEIGSGLGAHLSYENLKEQEYVALDIRPEMAEMIRSKFPGVQTVTGDCQKRIDFPDHYFDRVLAIHVLEHLPDLPSALLEVKRVLKPDGTFCIMIPCDPGFAYSIARNISARPFFEKQFHQSYNWLIKVEHINRPDEIISELKTLFQIKHQTYFPLVLPVKNINLVIGLTLQPR